jgi:N-acylneuraminate cytidylyltransferase
MIDDRTVLAVIPARGQSKGLPGKHLMDAGGKPVIAWSIEAAHGSRYIDRVILSSEDEDIIAVARKWECEVPFVRPASLAGDESKVEDAIFHALDALHETFDYVVLLQPTSPLRAAGDIDRCLEVCREQVVPACVSVSVPRKSPYWMHWVDERGAMRRVLPEGDVISRRQDLPTVYAVNGAVYVAETQWFRQHGTFLHAETHAYVMPVERAIDLDEPLDLVMLRAILDQAGRGE